MDRRDRDERYDRREYDRYERENFGYDDDYFDRNYNIKSDRYDDYDDRKSSRHAKEEAEWSPYVEGSIPSNVVISYPKTYGEIRVLIDSLKHRQPIIADLAKINDESAQRLLDFMSGAVYALSGSMHRVTGTIFLLTPEGMSIKIPMELKKSLENN